MALENEEAPRRELPANLLKTQTTLGTSLVRIAPVRVVRAAAVLMSCAADLTFSGGCHDLAG
jgi:hypothetical protein